MSQNKPRFRLLVAVFAVASMICGSFVVVAHAAPGKGKGGRPGPKPSASARPEKPAKPERPEKPEKPEKLIQTRLGFRLDTRHISPDGSVAGQARLGERVGKGFVPFAGQALHVFVDKEKQDEVTTDAEGMAVITATGDVGGHVVQVVYEGDATHRPARRAQGFHVGEETGEKEGCPPPPPEGDGGDEMRAFSQGKGGPGKGGPGDRKPPKSPKPCGDDDQKVDEPDDDAKDEDDDKEEDDKEDDSDESVDDTTDDEGDVDDE